MEMTPVLGQFFDMALLAADFGFWPLLRILGGIVAVLEKICKFEAEVARVGGIANAGIEIDEAGADKLFDFAVEVLHAFGITVAHGVEQSFAFILAFLDIIAGAHGGLENLN